jgi:hypothetical protein
MMDFTQLLSFLQAARTQAQALHWATTSFAQHVALGDLVDSLAELTDALAEMQFGVPGQSRAVEPSKPESWQLSGLAPADFAETVAARLEQFAAAAPMAAFTLNKYQELQGEVSTAAYKLRNLA